MKPKIPKSGKSLYRGFYIRKLNGGELVYHIASGIWIGSIYNGIDVKAYIDKRYDEITNWVEGIQAIWTEYGLYSWMNKNYEY